MRRSTFDPSPLRANNINNNNNNNTNNNSNNRIAHRPVAQNEEYVGDNNSNDEQSLTDNESSKCGHRVLKKKVAERRTFG